MSEKGGYVYLMTNERNTVIYTGVTSNLLRRIYEQKHKLADGFTKRYNVSKLVHYEAFDTIEAAIIKEKQIKGGSRQKKMDLIERTNRNYRDLYDEL